MRDQLNDDQRAWVQTTFDGLTRRERLGQLLVPMLTAETVAPRSMSEYVAQTGVAGGHIFGGTIDICRDVAAEVQAAAKVPLLITADFENGCGTRIAEGTWWPTQMAVGATGDPSLAYAMGTSIALEATAIGVNWNFAPIVDLAAAKDYLRQVDSFGRDAQTVGRFAAQIIRGLQDNGLAATAKHFPGNGFDDRDQHMTTLVNPLSAEQWWRQSAVPFQAAIAAGVWTIMVSAIGLPALDPHAGDPRHPTPGVLSPDVVTGLLRQQLGFDGVLVTDAMNMGGVSSHYRQMDRYRLALAAGNDVLLFVHEVDKTLDHLEGCLGRGDLDADAIDTSVRRVLSVKALLGLGEQRMVDEPTCTRVFADTAGDDDAQRVADRSITLIRDDNDIVPLQLPAGAAIAVVLITNQDEERFTLDPFCDTLTAGGCDVTFIRDPNTVAIHDRVAAGEFDAVVMGLYFPVQFGWNATRMHGPFSRCVMSGFTIAHPDTKAVYISFSNPYHLYELPFMDPYLLTYGGCPASQKAAAKALLGQIPISGRIPCELKDFWAIGDGVQRDATG